MNGLSSFFSGFANISSLMWILLLLLALAGFGVQLMLKARFRKYSAVPLGMSGAEVAEKMLRDHGITDVKVQSVAGELTDHYNPQTKVVNLSEDVFHGRNVAAAAVAAHECGHAVQHQVGYAPLRLRSALVPVTNFASNAVSWVILAGLLLVKVFPALLWIGIGLMAVTTLFSIVTLPVELNASARAVKWLENAGIVSYETRPLAADALKWAALTYVVAAVSSIISLLYYISLARSR